MEEYDRSSDNESSAEQSSSSRVRRAQRCAALAIALVLGAGVAAAWTHGGASAERRAPETSASSVQTVLALSQAGGPLETAAPSSTLPTPSSLSGSTDAEHYFYVGGRQEATATGASVSLEQEQPKLGASAAHSLMELAVETADSQNIVEIGWTVDPGLNGDSSPHLFVYHWVNGQPTCYNACGFVSESSKVVPGESLAAGSVGTFAITFAAGAWRMDYDGQEFGYFPGSLWGDNFTSGSAEQVFGEVSSSSDVPCAQMGTGASGTSAQAAHIRNFQLFGSAQPTALQPYETSPYYNYGSPTATGMTLGGPGGC